jgi:hypothetical protein
MADKNSGYDDPAHWHGRDIICKICESGFAFDMNEDSLGRQDRGAEGVWVTAQCPRCLNDVPLHKLND